MVIDWSKPLRDVPDDMVEKFRQQYKLVLAALGFKVRMYETKLGQSPAVGLCDCCGASNYTIPGVSDRSLRFRGFAPFLSEKQMKEVNYVTPCGAAHLEEFSIKRKEFSYTDPETKETLYYTIAIQGCSDGIELYEGEDDDF